MPAGRALGILRLAAALFLGGCLGPGNKPEPVLVVVAQEGQPTVAARVEGARGDLYRWDWGDGSREETTRPAATHTYAALDVYIITVEVINLTQGGDGGPGPGNQTVPTIVTTLTAVVDLRPALELVGINVLPLDPPSWYNPAVWPKDCFPAAINLQLSPLLRIHRPGPVKPLRAVWTIYDDGGFIYQTEGDPALFPYDKFLGPGCMERGRKEYRIRLVLFLSNGEVLEATKVICACPPRGCG